MVDEQAHLRVVWALRRAFTSVEVAKERRLREVGLPSAHYAVLINLVQSPGITGAELARRLLVTPQNVAALIARLEGQGLVERRPHPRHRHVREVHASPAGRDLLEAADHEVSSLERELVTGLGADDADTLRELLDRITQQLP